MKERDAARRDALRLILASLRAAEKELQRPLQRGRGAAGAPARAQAAGRVDRGVRAAPAARTQAAAEEAELAVLEEFMPEPLSEDELEQIVDDAIAEVGATSIRDLGRVMADVMPQIAGRADGSAVSQLVREKLGLTDAGTPAPAGPSARASLARRSAAHPRGSGVPASSPRRPCGRPVTCL